MCLLASVHQLYMFICIATLALTENLFQFHSRSVADASGKDCMKYWPSDLREVILFTCLSISAFEASWWPTRVDLFKPELGLLQLFKVLFFCFASFFFLLLTAYLVLPSPMQSVGGRKVWQLLCGQFIISDRLVSLLELIHPWAIHRSQMNIIFTFWIRLLLAFLSSLPAELLFFHLFSAGVNGIVQSAGEVQ